MIGEEVAAAAPRSTGRRRLARVPLVLVGLLGLVVIGGAIAGLVVLLVPSLNHVYAEQNLTETFLPPLSDGHPLGTDNLGRDLMWRCLAGLGISLLVGIGVSLVSLVLGLTVGILAGFFGKFADNASTLVVDVTWAFPAILLAIVLTGAMGPGLLTVILALALTTWAGFARLVRGETLSIREREFIGAARVLGVSRVRASIRHIVPLLIPLTLVMSAFFVSTSVAAEAGLSFLGLGTQPPTPSLGAILADGRLYLSVSPWPVIVAGGLLAMTVFFFNTIGDLLRDRLDPRESLS